MTRLLAISNLVMLDAAIGFSKCNLLPPFLSLLGLESLDNNIRSGKTSCFEPSPD